MGYRVGGRWPVRADLGPLVLFAAKHLPLAFGELQRFENLLGCRRHGRTFGPLTRHLSRLQAFKQIIPAGATEAEDLQPRIYQGYEWLLVLSGRLRLILGKHDLVLAAGEAVEFDTRVPHVVANAGSEDIELLCLFGPQGERVHVRARPAGR